MHIVAWREPGYLCKKSKHMMTREEIAAIDRECEEQHISQQECLERHYLSSSSISPMFLNRYSNLSSAVSHSSSLLLNRFNSAKIMKIVSSCNSWVLFSRNALPFPRLLGAAAPFCQVLPFVKFTCAQPLLIINKLRSPNVAGGHNLVPPARSTGL